MFYQYIINVWDDRYKFLSSHNYFGGIILDIFMYRNRKYALDTGKSAKGLDSWIYLYAESKIDDFEKLPMLYNINTHEISLNFTVLYADSETHMSGNVDFYECQCTSRCRMLVIKDKICPRYVSKEKTDEYNVILSEIMEDPADFHKDVKRVVINAVL